ncbi:unnamed protein product [Penicillium pancosmium]
MARTSQTARDSNEEPSRWLQQEYLDHKGNKVILGKWVRWGRQFYQPEEIEGYRLQIYSTLPIQPENFRQLYGYFFSESRRFPFLEIYSYNPSDALSCAEHQRGEVAYRKRLHAEQRGDVNDTILPPLIPTMRHGCDDQFMSGFCFLLISRSYLQGPFCDNDHGPGPLWISFDRSLPSALKKLPMIKRLSSSPTELRTFAEWGIAVNPEMIDVTVRTTDDQSGFGYDINDLMRKTISLYVDASNFEFDYGLYEPLPPPSQDNLTLQYTRELLEQQQTDDIQAEESKKLILLWGPENKSLTVKNTTDEECDLQYVIYVPFLADIEQETTTFLEATARKFTASIILHLSIFKTTVSKTVRFEFRIPDSSSLSYFLSAPPDGFDIGASHEFETAPGLEMRIRALPMVILDKPSFTQEPSVVFFTLETNGGTDIEISRSAGIHEVVRRLAMLAVEENIQDDARTLTREEHRELLSLSREEYEQKMAECGSVYHRLPVSQPFYNE